MSEAFDPFRKWLGISPKNRPPSHYDLLGVSLDEEDAEVIAAAHQQRYSFVDSQRGSGHDKEVTAVLYQLDEAKQTLLDRELRRDYDRRLNLFSRRKRKRQIDPNASAGTRDELPPRVQREGSVVGEGNDFLRTYGWIVLILTVAFGAMLWWSFQQPWGDPPAVTDGERPNALFDAIADDADELQVDAAAAVDGQDVGEAPLNGLAASDQREDDVNEAGEVRPVGRYLVRWKQRPPGTRSGEHNWDFLENGEARSDWGKGRLSTANGVSKILMTGGAEVTIESGDSESFVAVYRNVNRGDGLPDDVSDWKAERIGPVNAARTDRDGDNWISIFNGQDLTGWKGNVEHWRVDDGVLTGRVVDGRGLLIYDRQLKDFALRLKFQHQGMKGNAGVLFRSVMSDEPRRGLVGPQIEIDDKLGGEGFGFYGGIYQSGGPEEGWNPERFGLPQTFQSRWLSVTPASLREELLRSIVDREFSDLLVEIHGSEVRVVINGIETVKRELPTIPSDGYIAIEMLRQSDDEILMAFKDIELRTFGP